MSESEQGLEHFLQFLSTFPDPQRLASSLLHGPLALFGARACDLWVGTGSTELMRLANDGHEDTLEIYERVSLGFQAPITETFINGSTLVIRLSCVLDEYPNLAVDGDYWQGLSDNFGDGDLAHVPIFSAGQPIGVITFLCDRVNEWTAARHARLSSVAAALGLWMSHQSSGVMELSESKSSNGLWLTPRQTEILNLVRAGRTNGAIGAHLGYSQSTVKQELRRITKRLHVSSREAAVSKATELNLLPPAPNEIENAE